MLRSKWSILLTPGKRNTTRPWNSGRLSGLSMHYRRPVAQRVSDEIAASASPVLGPPYQTSSGDGRNPCTIEVAGLAGFIFSERAALQNSVSLGPWLNQTFRNRSICGLCNGNIRHRRIRCKPSPYGGVDLHHRPPRNPGLGPRGPVPDCLYRRGRRIVRDPCCHRDHRRARGAFSCPDPFHGRPGSCGRYRRDASASRDRPRGRRLWVDRARRVDPVVAGSSGQAGQELFVAPR